MVAPETDARAILGTHSNELEAALQRAIGRGEMPLESAARYVMGWEDQEGNPTVPGAKRIRPGLCIFSTLAFGGSLDEAMPGAVAVELVHNFSLVHDEIQDHDAARHHRPTLWALMGEAQAINAGDFLYTRAVRALIDGRGDVNRRMSALAILNEAITRMIDGQWRDIDFESRDNVSLPEYLDMVAGKTGALLRAPLQMGAVLAGAAPEAVNLIGAWGALVGAAFQAQDDYLGVWGDPGQTGKSNTNDIARKKKSLPVVHGLADPGARAIIHRAYANDVLSADDIRQVVAMLESAGSDTYCRELARRQVAESSALLEKLPFDSATRASFDAIAHFLVERQA